MVVEITMSAKLCSVAGTDRLAGLRRETIAGRPVLTRAVASLGDGPGRLRLPARGPVPVLRRSKTVLPDSKQARCKIAPALASAPEKTEQKGGFDVYKV